MTGNSLQTTSPVFVRSADGVIAGVCESMGRQMSVDPWIIRIAWLLSIVAFGTGLVLYLIAAFTLPREDELVLGQQKRLLGVCARIAQRTGMEVGLVRLAAVLGLFLSAGLAVVGYFIAHFAMDSHDNRVL